MHLWNTPTRDDHVLPITRWIGGFIILVLLLAVLILYGMPGRTTEYFAWTIRPDMTPLVMGSGYAAGVYFFYLWVILYAVTPFLVPGLWWLNRQTDPKHLRETDNRLPRVVRIIGSGLGLTMTISALVVFLVPEILIGVWPWTVSPLTTRIWSGWFALFGVVNVAVALDARWSATKVLLESEMVGFGLIVIGTVRAWDDFDPSNVLTWLFIGGVAVYLIAILVLYASFEFR